MRRGTPPKPCVPLPAVVKPLMSRLLDLFRPIFLQDSILVLDFSRFSSELRAPPIWRARFCQILTGSHPLERSKSRMKFPSSNDPTFKVGKKDTAELVGDADIAVRYLLPIAAEIESPRQCRHLTRRACRGEGRTSSF